MPALTIDGTPVHALRWLERPELPHEATGEGYDRSRASLVTDARPHRMVVEFEGGVLLRADATALDASLESGRVELAGDLPGATLTATAHDLRRIEDPQEQGVTLYGAVAATFLIDPDDP